MRSSIITLLCLGTLTFAPVAPAAPIDLWGIKNCDGDTQCPAVGDGSTVPAHIFQIRSDGSGFGDHGQVLLGTTAIDADGLAWSGVTSSTLYAFRIEHDDPNAGKNGTASQLITLDVSSPTAASAVGTVLDGRDVRGAAFDSANQLWALDAAMNEILRIDPLTGSILENGSLLDGGSAIDISTGSDIAFRPDGSAVIANGSDFYSVDLAARTLVTMFSDSGFHAGLAYEPMSADLITFEVNGTDDLFRFNAGGAGSFVSTPPFGFNAGRGDLAALVEFTDQDVPEPAAPLLLATGLLALAFGHRFRSAAAR